MKNKKFIIIGLLILVVFLLNRGVQAAPEVLYGDVDGNGEVDSIDVTKINLYLEGGQDLDYDSQIRADVDKDNYITENDSKLVQKYIVNQIELPVKMGDLNEDGKVDSEDVQILQSGITNASTLTTKQKILGDVNVDNEANELDETLIMRYIDGDITRLPVIEGKPIVKDEVVPESEKESKITQKIEVKEKNPETGSALYIYIIAFILVTGLAVFGTYKYQKKMTK